MARFVLVHGAWHGGWCFRTLAEELELRGHDVLAPDLPCDQIGLTQLDYARLLGPAPDAVVVGHSLGGQTIAHMEARLRVYLGAILPVENPYAESFAAGFGGFLRDELGRSYWPDPETTAANLYADCTPAQSDWAFERLRHQAPIDAIAVAGFGRGDVVIAMLGDTVVDPGWQIRTGKEHGAYVIDLDAGHSPFFTRPDELADVLSSLA
jgi:pimeloyl-ACP methyl ester carboxylesterase